MDNYTLVSKKYEAMIYRGALSNDLSIEEIANAIFPQIKHFDITSAEVLTEVKRMLG